MRKISVLQLGARMHYAVPKIFDGAGLLKKFYTDFDASHGWCRALGATPALFRPRSIKRLLGRRPEMLATEQVISFNAFGLSYALRHRWARDEERLASLHLWGGRKFCGLALSEGLSTTEAVYVFNTAALEVLRYCRRNGIPSILEQTIAPRRVEVQLLREEAERHPEWRGGRKNSPKIDEFCEREELEWELTDLIVCGSEFVAESLRATGHKGPIRVVPYGFNIPACQKEARPRRQSKLNVLTVGEVGLRKGSPYVLEAAKRLSSIANFRMIGGVSVSGEALKALATHCELVGAVPRSEVGSHYAWADVFFLPSICEGSATATYEALAYGLPVICTANTGSVVRDGEFGYIVPIRDVEAMVRRLRSYAENEALRIEHSRNAFGESRSHTVAAYGTRLLDSVLPILSN